MKERERLALFLLSLIWLVLTLHLLALNLFLYWRFWWYDNIVHFLGGFWLSGATIWFIYYSGYSKWRPTLSRLLPIVLSSVLLIAIDWEIYEYALGAAYGGEGYVLDTTFDLISDFVGGLVGYYLISRFTNHFLINQQNHG